MCETIHISPKGLVSQIYGQSQKSVFWQQEIWHLMKVRGSPPKTCSESHQALTTLTTCPQLKLNER